MKHDCGHAIPTTRGASEGLSKREYYAAHAPETVPSWYKRAAHTTSEEDFFAWRWYYADMMIKTGG